MWNVFEHLSVRMNARFSRRRLLCGVSGAAVAGGTLSFVELMSVQAEQLRSEGKSLILLWMQGGPSQLETFDPKPGTETGGPTTAIETAVPGIRLAEGWEPVAKVMDDVAVIRSLTNKEGQHQRAQYQLHTGYIPTGTVKHPNLGCAIAQELAAKSAELPAVVSVGPTEGAGFLGVNYEPFVVQQPGQMPRNVSSPVPTSRLNRRLGLLGKLEGDFAARGAEQAVADHRKLYDKTSRLVLSPAVKAFDISEESARTREAYGETEFGKGCLLARRLVEAGVTFVEVKLNGWDTHLDNFDRVKKLSGEAAPGMGALISDLKSRGMLDRTLVVWMGEFGRTPRINPRTGRDHYPRVFSAALAGCGVKGGQVIGASTADGMAIKDAPVQVPDLLYSMCQSLGVNPAKENISPLGRPLKIVDGGAAIPGLLKG